MIWSSSTRARSRSRATCASRNAGPAPNAALERAYLEAVKSSVWEGSVSFSSVKTFIKQWPCSADVPDGVCNGWRAFLAAPSGPEGAEALVTKEETAADTEGEYVINAMVVDGRKVLMIPLRKLEKRRFLYYMLLPGSKQ